MDEMSTQLIGEVRAPLASKPGKPLRYGTEYKRNGTANIFIAIEPLPGQRYTKVTEQRTKVDWAYFIQELLDQHYPHVEKLRLVMDNLNTHTKASLYEAFDPPEAKRIADKLETHYIPWPMPSAAPWTAYSPAAAVAQHPELSLAGGRTRHRPGDRLPTAPYRHAGDAGPIRDRPDRPARVGHAPASGGQLHDPGVFVDVVWPDGRRGVG